MNNALVKKMAADLNIPQEENESDECWQCRVLYSVTGMQMLASLYDYDDGSLTESESTDNTVSMQHVLMRGEKLSGLYELSGAYAEQIRELYIATGFMLHKNNRLAYPSYARAKSGSVTYYRGLHPWETTNVSGLGIFDKAKVETVLNVEDMFCIGKQNIGEWLNDFIKDLHWIKIQNLPNEVEYLNVTEEPKMGYWRSEAPKQGLSMYRTKSEGERMYSLIRIGDTIESYELAQWRVKSGEYRRISIALRVGVKNTPTVRFKKRKYTTEVDFDYLLPPAEQSFIELYSWSKEEPTLGLKYLLSRVISTEVTETFKTIFNRLGFSIEEV